VTKLILWDMRTKVMLALIVLVKDNFVDTKAQFINLVFVWQALRLQFQLGNVSYINLLYSTYTTST
jgi:hypothetical protein